MFRTCIHCHRNLGGNEVVENFPVGRRLAFDSGKGRLWVICDECRQWNLTPLEERWEALEECERAFHDTQRRFCTDNIGLARLDAGLDLVRIGQPKRPEYAAWRYGRQFLQRRVAVEAAMVFNAVVAIYDTIVSALSHGERQRVVTRVRAPDGRRLPLTRVDLRSVRLVRADAPSGWILWLPHRSGAAQRKWWRDYAGNEDDTVELSGSDALRAAGKILPKLNPYGGNEFQLKWAVKLIEEAGGPELLFSRRSAKAGSWRSDRFFDVDASVIKTMDLEARLALEMAAHEETERRAFEGELKELEDAWREAEQIAAIADRLLIPEEIEEWIRREKGGER